MKLSKLPSVDVAIRTLDEQDRQRVSVWLDHLRNWEKDEQVRSLSQRLRFENTYALTTPDDLRIFFTLDAGQEEIVVLDLAKPSRFPTVLPTLE